MNNNSLAPLSEQEQIIKRRMLKANIQKENRMLFFSLIRMLVGIAVFVLVFLCFFSFRVIEGNSMYPAMSDGDLVLTYKFTSEYKKDDIVLYTLNDKEYVGRVVAKAGDNVSFSDDGKFYVNGTVQLGEIVFPTYLPNGKKESLIVPKDSVYVLGDHRTQSTDSRDFGAIPIKDIRSRVIALIRHKTI